MLNSHEWNRNGNKPNEKKNLSLQTQESVILEDETKITNLQLEK
jgi:hypothetical protein